MLRRFTDYIAQHHLMPPGAHVVAGVSGGPDSVVLLYLLHKAGYSVTTCHVNYRLRLPAADDDEAFVSDLCARFHLSFRVRRVDDPSELDDGGGSTQNAARELRYRFYRETAESVGSRHIALGHHADDQVETVLFNLFRGAGPEGLAGMVPSRPIAQESNIAVVRPLLWARRGEIEAYGHAHGLSWRDDASNLTSAYRRNDIRNRIIPVITDVFGEGAINVIDRNASILREWFDEVCEPALADWRERAVAEAADGGYRISLDVLREMPGVIRSKILLDSLQASGEAPERSFAVAEELERLIDAQPGARKVFRNVEAWRDRDAVLIQPRTETAPDEKLLLQPGETVRMAGLDVALSLVETPPSPKEKPPSVEYLDAASVERPLTLRRWKDGDVFQPLGSEHKVKLSDFLTDLKIPPSRKRDVLVLESNGTICCLPGLRIDHRFRVTERTVRVLAVETLPA